jgi:hypothetical protein
LEAAADGLPIEDFNSMLGFGVSFRITTGLISVQAKRRVAALNRPLTRLHGNLPFQIRTAISIFLILKVSQR